MKIKKEILKQLFKGKPYTRFKTNKAEEPSVTVTISELTPLGARIADGFAKALTWAGLAYTIHDTMQLASADWKIWLAAIALPIVMYPLTRWSIRSSFKSTTTVSFDKNTFRIGHWPFAKKFDRQLHHSFKLLPHDKREEAKEKHQLKAMRQRSRGQFAEPEQYYSKSFNLIFEFLGERIDIAEIWGEREAARALERLNTIDNVINTETDSGAGYALSPDKEWNPQAGDLKD